MYIQPYSNSNFRTIVFVVALLIGMGLLIYYAVDITVENSQFSQDNANLQAALAARNTEVTTLTDEITTCNAAKTSLTEDVARLQADLDQANQRIADLNEKINDLQSELDQALKINASLQAYVNAPSQVDGLRKENDELRSSLQQCVNTVANPNILQASILPTNPYVWIVILAIMLLIGVSLWIIRDYKAHFKKVSVLPRRGPSQERRDPDVIRTRMTRQ